MTTAIASDPLYFKRFEHRVRPKPLAHDWRAEALWQFLAIVTLGLGAWYLHWRWTASLNIDALWFAIPLVVAETGAYFGMLLFVFNLWKVKDTKKQSPPSNIGQLVASDHALYGIKRAVSVDVMITTYNEDIELVRHSVIDAKKIKYPYPITLSIYVLDDGKRDEARRMAKEEGVYYITRDNNRGFKAGNLRNALMQTSGDFILICDADTRPYDSILHNTLGYFKDSNVSWVQTPQWFYDIPEGIELSEHWRSKTGFIGYWSARGIEKIFGKIKVGEDPFCNDYRVFYDIIQRRRNGVGASFCCGAGSIHRREAVIENALKNAAQEAAGSELALRETEVTPYRFHVSEDIYTSIDHHSDNKRKWKSVYHPEIECRMLSPQDLYSWMVQRFKYAGGSIDIMLNDNPIFRKGMPFKTKMMYAATFYSYIGCIWNVIFFLGPIVYLMTSYSPVMSYTSEFFKHFLPFLIMNEIAFMFGTWGKSTFKNKAHFLAFFPINFRALWTVLRGKEIRFKVTPKMRERESSLWLVWPHLLFIALTIIGLCVAYTCFFIIDDLRYGPNGLVINSFWAAYNIYVLMTLVKAATWCPKKFKHGV